MRRIILGGTGIEASCLGFGCASLGSRVPREEGLRALAAVFEQGVDWLDLAPAYGRGQAETIAAEFIRGRRDRLRLCTKVGLAPPRNAGGLKGRVMGAAMPLARKAIGAVPALRGLARASGATANTKLPLTPELLRGSLEQSLARLGTDHVDLYALHNAEAAEIARDDILRALEEILASGKARAVAVATSPEVAEAAIGRGAPFGVVQLALPDPGRPDMVFAAARGSGFGAIGHSVFGVEGALAGLEARLGADPVARAEVLAAAGVDQPRAALGRLLLARAFAINPEGIVLASMFSGRSRSENIAMAGAAPGDAARALIDRLAA
ncbi:aldo/keto reductase [Amaricoccus solimangrovi]|uniref:Aldo/keto reductase n=1 Tax=Amaricoccus solimangrovi TaxID=2589815 RepID=A0A501WI13_9RHOB|nr:aldo/keto reductase [Amaricoccus solimangrovi]TPE48422.1 aldo/keto reductase [Amaricoccus solimangrovi]